MRWFFGRLCVLPVCMCVLSHSVVSDSVTYSYGPPGSSAHGILQARILKWIAMPFFRRCSWPRDQTQVSCISCTGRWVLYLCKNESVSLSVMSNSFEPMDCSLPGSSFHGILQARILKWIAISFSRRSSQPSGWTHISCLAGIFFTTKPPGSPNWCIAKSKNSRLYATKTTVQDFFS